MGVHRPDTLGRRRVASRDSESHHRDGSRTPARGVVRREGCRFGRHPSVGYGWRTSSTISRRREAPTLWGWPQNRPWEGSKWPEIGLLSVILAGFGGLSGVLVPSRACACARNPVRSPGGEDTCLSGCHEGASFVILTPLPWQRRWNPLRLWHSGFLVGWLLAQGWCNFHRLDGWPAVGCSGLRGPTHHGDLREHPGLRRLLAGSPCTVPCLGTPTR